MPGEFSTSLLKGSQNDGFLFLMYSGRKMHKNCWFLLSSCRGSGSPTASFFNQVAQRAFNVKVDIAMWQFPIWDDQNSKKNMQLHPSPTGILMPRKTEDQIEAKFTFEPLGFGLETVCCAILYNAIHASPTKIEAFQNEFLFPGTVVEIYDHPNWRQKCHWETVQI